jgi:hypothetical protein
MSQPKHQLHFFYDYVFPNFILPNALNREMAMINYIHTQYVGGANTDAFLERDLGRNDSLIRQIFGEHMGHWPNSIRHNGSHLRYECFQEVVDIVEESVYLGKQRRQRYIYPIKISPHINDFLGLAHAGRKIIDEHFWKNISEEVLHDVRAGTAVIFLDWAQENHLTPTQLQQLNNSVAAGDLPKEGVVFAHNGFNLEEEYDRIIPKEQQRLTIKNWPFLMYHNSWHWAHHPEFRFGMDEFLASKNQLRDNYFLFRIRRCRSYRIAVLYRMASDGLLQLGDWSMLDTSLPEWNGLAMANDYQLGYNEQIVAELYKTFPHKLKSEPFADFNNRSGWGDTDSTHSLTSYFDITTETYMEGNYKSFTEKVCKPLMTFQPFVLFSFHGALAMLRELGFKTFNGFIDESYDTEPDHIKRTAMAYKEIKRLCSMSRQQLHDWYWSMEEILIHNHKHFLDFYKKDQYNLDLIKYLESRIADV